jgi:HlyD family secretion protein
MNSSSLWKRRAGLGIGALVLIGALAWVAVKSGPWAPTRVTTTRVANGALQPALFGIGTVEARRSHLLGPTATARVLKVHVDVGDLVQPGQLLAELDPVDLDQRVAALDASLTRARSLVTSAEAQQRDAQARRELATANARRYAELSAQEFISAGALEARQQEQRSADAAVQAADAALAASRQDLQRLGAERAGLSQQRDRLRLSAPAAGVIASREAEPGSTVVAGQAVLRLIDPASLWLKVRFDQGRAAGLAAGQPAQVALRSRPGQVLPGRIARLEPLGDAVTEERIAQVALDALPAGLTVGELAEVTVQLAPTTARPWVPNAALQQRGGQTGVWRVAEGRPVFTPLQLGSGDLDGRVQVLDGLKAGDAIVVYSEKALSADARLRVVDALAGGSAGSTGPAK